MGSDKKGRKRGLIPRGVQYRTLREFCVEHEFEPHETFQLFRRIPEEPWILYRRGLPHRQKMKISREEFPGWTFDMSLSGPEEDRLYKGVCLHFVKQDSIAEKVKYSAKRDFVAYAEKLNGKRLYVSEAQRRIFDSARDGFLKSLRDYPMFEK